MGADGKNKNVMILSISLIGILLRSISGIFGNHAKVFGRTGAGGQRLIEIYLWWGL